MRSTILIYSNFLDFKLTLLNLKSHHKCIVIISSDYFNDENKLTYDTNGYYQSNESWSSEQHKRLPLQ